MTGMGRPSLNHIYHWARHGQQGRTKKEGLLDLALSMATELSISPITGRARSLLTGNRALCLDGRWLKQTQKRRMRVPPLLAATLAANQATPAPRNGYQTEGRK